MMKRFLALVLCICMVLTLVTVPASAATTGAMDNIPSSFDKEIDLVNEKGDINIGDSKTYYIYSSSNDPEWVWTKKIQVNGRKAAPHIFLDNVNIQVKEDAKTPAIELHGKASAYLYFINRDSKLTGATGRAAIQKNRSEGQLCVQVMKGTTVTCQGGFAGAGIGGSFATRDITDKVFNIDMYGHGVNMHFGSQTNPTLWSGTIIAKGGKYSAGIGGGRGGSGEKLYFYSGKIEATGGPMGAGIGGSFKGRGSDIYIYDGDISATGGEGAPGIGGGCWTERQDMNSVNAARNINIYGGKVYACGGYNGAGIGGGQYVPAHDINITGGEITAHGAYGAAIGGGRWRHGQNITVTDAKLTLTTGYNQYASSAAVMGYGDLVYSGPVYRVVDGRQLEDFVREPSMKDDYKSIKVGSTKGKLVKLKVETQALTRNDEFTFFWDLYDILIPNANGRIDVQLLTLPYVQNYGWAINKMEMELIDDPCNGNHDFGWVDRQSCHVWACRNRKCQARDPVAPESANNGEHKSSGWNTEKHQLICDVCGHVMETDTKAPVLEVLENGKDYTAEDTSTGTPGAYTFTVSDPAASGETSSGVKSVTINGKEQTVGANYSLPAPDGGNNDAGNEYTVVATDNAGNTTTATVKVYRRHRVQVISPDGSKTYVDKLLAHNEYLILTMKLPDDAAVTLTDQADGSEIPYDKDKKQFTVGLIDRSRTLVLDYSTEYPTLELQLGRSQYFTGYNADDEAFYLDDVGKHDGFYRAGLTVTTNAERSYYFSSTERYTLEQLEELDDDVWTEYKLAEPGEGVIVLPFVMTTIDAKEYEEKGTWYIYAKATNVKGTTYVSTPNLIADVEAPKAINLSTKEELVERSGQYWGDLKFKVEDASPVKVWHRSGGDTVFMTPDKDGVYTIPADYSGSVQHTITIKDACGNEVTYAWFKVSWNYLLGVDRRDHWEEKHALRISKEEVLADELEKLDIVVNSAASEGWMSVDVDWEIPETYDPKSPREQTFTVNGTVILEGTKDNEKNPSGLDVVPCPGKESMKNISVQVTVEGDPQYKVAVQNCENGSVTVTNAVETVDDTPVFYKDDTVMFSVVPDEGYQLKELKVTKANGSVDCESDDGEMYSFTQPGENVTVTATFEKMKAAEKPTISVEGEYVYDGSEQTADVKGVDGTMIVTGHTGTNAGDYTVTVTSKTGAWADGSEEAVTAAWRIERATQEAPEGLAGAVTSGEGASDGKITGVDSTMEYRAEGESVYTACTGTEITGLAAGKYYVRYREDGNHFAGADAKVTVTVGQVAPTITTASLADGRVGEAYSAKLAATGTGPIKWEVTGGALPEGLSLNAATGEISGTPTAAGTASFTVTATNGVGSVSKALSITIAEAPPLGPVKPTISVTGSYRYTGVEQTAQVTGYDADTMRITGHTGTNAGDYTVTVTSKSGKWADGSTDAVTAAWRIERATQNAPAGLVGIAPTVEGESDGKITGVDDTMEYRAANGSDYTTCTGTEISGLTAGTYFVRYKEDANHFASSDTAVTMGDGETMTRYAVRFEANGGTGTMTEASVAAGSNYVLPECGFTPPADQTFQAWEIDGGTYKAGDSYTVNGETVVKALWKSAAVTPTTYTVTVTDDGNGTGKATPAEAAAGTEIALNVTAKEGYHFKEWQVVDGEISISNGKFTMPEGNVTVRAVFEAHSYGGDWLADKDGHWQKCSCGAAGEKAAHADDNKDHKCDTCGWTMTEHTGGKATCTEQAVCEICNEKYGKTDPDKHSGKTGGWQKGDGKHWKVYDCCQAHAEEGDHNSVKDAAKAATCEETGLTEGAHCGTCGEVLTKQETVKALGHDWGPWTVTTSPTTTSEGVETRTCRNDASHTETRSISKLTPTPRPDPTPGKTGGKTDSDKTVQSGRTGDMGIGLYAATALLSLTGTAWVSKKRKK